MPAGRYDITLEAYSKWTRTFTYERPKGTPVSLTGANAQLVIREKVDDTTALITLDETAGITLGGAAGTLLVSITSTQTGALSVENGVYDLRVKESGGDWERLLEGDVKIKMAVTRTVVA